MRTQRVTEGEMDILQIQCRRDERRCVTHRVLELVARLLQFPATPQRQPEICTNDRIGRVACHRTGEDRSGRCGLLSAQFDQPGHMQGLGIRRICAQAARECGTCSFGVARTNQFSGARNIE